MTRACAAIAAMNQQQLSSSSSSSSRGFDGYSSSAESSVNVNDDGLRLPQRKRQKYHCSYQSSWESDENFGWVRKSKKGRDYAFCTLCSKEIKIASGGANDLLRHSETTLHQRSTVAVATTPNIATLFAANTTLATKVIRSEVLFASFVAEHNLPMNVSEHAGKLFKAMFPILILPRSLLLAVQKQQRLSRVHYPLTILNLLLRLCARVHFHF